MPIDLLNAGLPQPNKKNTILQMKTAFDGFTIFDTAGERISELERSTQKFLILQCKKARKKTGKKMGWDGMGQGRWGGVNGVERNRTEQIRRKQNRTEYPVLFLESNIKSCM